MKPVEDFVPLLGAPSDGFGAAEVRRIATDWGVVLPEEFVALAGAYGDALISGFIYFRGAKTLVNETSQRMRELLEAGRTVKYKILPSAGGVLMWGNTLEGDQLFLVPRENGVWTVSAFRRNWHDVYDSDLEFGEWFAAALKGETCTEWLPEWPPLPHRIERS